MNVHLAGVRWIYPGTLMVDLDNSMTPFNLVFVELEFLFMYK